MPDNPATTDTTLGPTSERGLYRAAGLGGILAAVSWAIQPFLVFVVVGDAGDELPTLEYLLSRPWGGAVEAVVFTGMGVGILLLVRAVHALGTRRLGSLPTSASVGYTCGLLAGGAWILLAGWFAALYTSVGEALGEATTDASLQQVALHVHNIGATGITLAAGLGFAGWLLSLLTLGRRAGVIGAPLAVLAAIAALAMLQPFLLPFTPPWGTLGTPAFCLIAGIAFLVRSRRVSATQRSSVQPG